MASTFPGSVARPNVHYVTTETRLLEVIAPFRLAQVLGYDHEWCPNRRGSDNNPVTVIQLAAAQDILVLQLTGFEGE